MIPHVPFLVDSKWTADQSSSVAVFGPVDEKVYGPFGGVAGFQVVTEPVSCRPCYARFHFPACPHNRQCLESLPVEKVEQAIAKII